MVSFKRKVYSATEYKDMVRAAEVLDLSPERHVFRGIWKTDTGSTVEPNNREKPIQKVGNKYFYVPVDGEFTPIKPGNSVTRTNGHVVVTFRG